MKRLLLLSLMFLCCIFITPVLYTNAQINNSFKTIYKDGDIIFQKSNSRQAQAVKLATHSDISHCGILFNEGGEWKVLEAVEPVQIVPLASWIARDAQGHYTIKRLKKEYNKLNDSNVSAMLSTGKKWIGKHYDIYFNWNDEQLYCSELVWKLYFEGTGLEICTPRKLKEFDLSNPFVKMMMNERYGKNIPYDENMVAPSDLFDSKKLELVVSE